MSKYHSRKTQCRQDHQHDSKKEAGRCNELTLMEKAGVIGALHQQPEYVLQGGFEYQGVKIRAIKYRADFSYVDMERSKFVVEDTKGFKTKVYRIKRKMFLKIMESEDFDFIES